LAPQFFHSVSLDEAGAEAPAPRANGILEGPDLDPQIFHSASLDEASAEAHAPRASGRSGQANLPSQFFHSVSLDEASAEAHVLAGGSLAVTGYGGTGKSFWARGVVQKLRDAGKVVQIIAKTHVACANFGMGAMTADHWAIKYVKKGSCPAQALVIEEFSQLSAYLWNEVAKLALKGGQFISLGDKGQLDPIKNVWAGCPVQISVNQTEIYRDLAAGFSIQMIENRRSDPPLFEFCTSLRAGRPDERPFQEAGFPPRSGFRT
jgi:hypothetical protein